MQLLDIFVFLFLGIALLGVSYQSGARAKEIEILKEGFSNEIDQGTNVYMFYSLTSIVPGRKCRENYKLFKLNRHYTQLWGRFRQYLENTGQIQNVSIKAINIDENPEYVAEFDITTTPEIIVEQNGSTQKYNAANESLPNLNDLIAFYESVAGPTESNNLQNYNDAVVYLYVPNCYDCRKYFTQWKQFKNEIKSVYPDIAVYEVNVADNADYEKYIYRFSPSVFPLVLTKSNNGKIAVSDIIQLYGSFSYDNLFRLVDETFFSQPVEDVTASANNINITGQDLYMNQIMQNNATGGSNVETTMENVSLTVEDETAGFRELLRSQAPGFRQQKSAAAPPSSRQQRMQRPQRASSPTRRLSRPSTQSRTFGKQRFTPSDNLIVENEIVDDEYTSLPDSFPTDIDGPDTFPLEV